jgi:hypothetical protein
MKMIDPSAIRALVARWRARIAQRDQWLTDRSYGGRYDGEVLDQELGERAMEAHGWRTCADELEALLDPNEAAR